MNNWIINVSLFSSYMNCNTSIYIKENTQVSIYFCDFLLYAECVFSYTIVPNDMIAFANTGIVKRPCPLFDKPSYIGTQMKARKIRKLNACECISIHHSLLMF